MLAFEPNSRRDYTVHARQNAASDPWAARICEESLEQIICFLEKLGCLSAPASRKLQVGELREEPGKQQSFAHAARRTDALTQRRLRL